MKVFIAGGTGLLGSAAAEELISHGHSVVSVALPPLPEGANLPENMQLTLGNYLEMTDDELIAQFKGCEGFVFASGVDERVESAPPVYAVYEKYNIAPVKRLLRLAKESGVKHAVVFGSYFSYFDKIRPELKLSKKHPYVRSRREQEDAALAFGSGDFDVAVLELPYIFGAQKGRKPVWQFIVDYARKGAVTMWPSGGSTMVTVKQVAQATLGALTKNVGANCYPIGYYNLSWKDMLAVFHKYIGCPKKKVITVPTFLFSAAAKILKRKQVKKGIEGGLDLAEISGIQCSELFIDKFEGCDALSVAPDDLDTAIGESVKLCLDIAVGKAGNVLNMKGE